MDVARTPVQNVGNIGICDGHLELHPLGLLGRRGLLMQGIADPRLELLSPRLDVPGDHLIHPRMTDVTNGRTLRVGFRDELVEDPLCRWLRDVEAPQSEQVLEAPFLEGQTGSLQGRRRSALLNTTLAP